MSSLKTKVFIDEFKGSKIFAIWETDEKGEKVGKYPLFSMGTKKAKTLTLHMDEFSKFADSAELND